MDYQYNTLLTTLAQGVLTLQLNRPDQMNSFTVEMANELVDFFTKASDDDAIGVVVVTGTGRAFCAGMDLSREGNVFGLDESLSPTLQDLQERGEESVIKDTVRDTGGRVTLSIFDCKKPVIAAINGAAVGIGLTMTLAMDIRLVSEKAKMGFVFGKLGIVNEACSSWFLPRIVGMQQALEWVYTSDIFGAQEALAGRLVKAVYAPDQLLAEAQALALRMIKGKSPIATALMRQMMYRNSAAPHPRDAHNVDSLAMFYTSIADGKEGVNAFLEKRDTAFTGRASQMPDFYPWWE
jgi:enoyl-CoA hydratase/carnithine racemase